MAGDSRSHSNTDAVGPGPLTLSYGVKARRPSFERSWVDRASRTWHWDSSTAVGFNTASNFMGSQLALWGRLAQSLRLRGGSSPSQVLNSLFVCSHAGTDYDVDK